MAPIGWSWALAVWGYALFWFVINDLVKQAAYKLLDGRSTETSSSQDSSAV